MIRYSPLLALAGSTLVAAGIFVNVAFSAAAPTSAQAVEPFTDQSCLDCHTNETRLRELAVVEEAEPESLSSGPG